MENYYTSTAPASGGAARPHKKHTRIWIVLGVLLLVAAIIAGCAGIARYYSRYIAVVQVEGEITGSPYTDIFGNVVGYDHSFTLSAIDDLMGDRRNEALLLYVNSPGGGVYESDELYLKLLEYKENTGRPVYVSFGQTAASGGYYISMAGDRIFSNRNCMTGSIGVRLNTMLDLTGLLEKLGVKAENITAGKNKAMGDPYTPMTEEQKQILQDYVDEAYEQFVDIVAAGRPNLTREEILTLADGRIYTPRQALEYGLIDEIATYEEALSALQEDYGLWDCEVRGLYPGRQTNLLGLLFHAMDALKPENEVESALKALQKEQSHGAYYCPAALN